MDACGVLCATGRVEQLAAACATHLMKATGVGLEDATGTRPRAAAAAIDRRVLKKNGDDLLRPVAGPEVLGPPLRLQFPGLLERVEHLERVEDGLVHVEVLVGR